MKLLIRLTVGYLVLSIGLASTLFPSAASAGNITNAAKQAGMTYLTGAIMNVAFGNKFTAKCTAPGGQVFCGMAALSFAQAMMDGSASSKSFDIQTQTKCQGILCGAGDPGFSDSAGNGLGTVDPSVFDNGTGEDAMSPEALAAAKSQINRVTREAAQGAKDMAEKGFTVNPKTGELTTPKGKISNASSEGGMAAMGMTPAQIEEATEMMKQAARSGLPRVDGGFGGGSGGGGTKVAARGPASEGFDMNAYMRSLQGGARKPASLNGLKKYVGNEAIGVSVDNIFDMVNRRYKAEAEHGKFLP